MITVNDEVVMTPYSEWRNDQELTFAVATTGTVAATVAPIPAPFDVVIPAAAFCDIAAQIDVSDASYGLQPAFGDVTIEPTGETYVDERTEFATWKLTVKRGFIDRATAFGPFDMDDAQSVAKILLRFTSAYINPSDPTSYGEDTVIVVPVHIPLNDNSD